MPSWYDIKPKALSKRQAKHPWLFAEYCEYPSEREDGQWYRVFLFRNEDRTCFGKKELSELVHYDTLRQLASRLVLEKDFRETLISDAPELPKLWKRH